MKKIKYFLIMLIASLTLSGCNILKSDTMEDINIITTSYPLEFVINYLYGEHSLVKSIYPDSVDTYTYKLNEKSLTDFSKQDLFVFVSSGRDKEIAIDLLKRNKKMLIIDGSLGMKPDYIDELWLNPSNLLMVSQNIKNGLFEYINNSFLKKEIDSNFEELKIKLSMLDAELKVTAENASSPTIVTGTKSLNYLKKYGFNVICLDDEEANMDKVIEDVTEMINLSKIKYIYTVEKTNDNKYVNLLLENNKNLSVIRLKRLDSITDQERNNKEDYFSLMNKNIQELKKETYK